MKTALILTCFALGLLACQGRPSSQATSATTSASTATDQNLKNQNVTTQADQTAVSGAKATNVERHGAKNRTTAATEVRSTEPAIAPTLNDESPDVVTQAPGTEDVGLGGIPESAQNAAVSAPSHEATRDAQSDVQELHRYDEANARDMWNTREKAYDDYPRNYWNRLPGNSLESAFNGPSPKTIFYSGNWEGRDQSTLESERQLPTNDESPAFVKRYKHRRQ